MRTLGACLMTGGGGGGAVASGGGMVESMGTEMGTRSVWGTEVDEDIRIEVDLPFG